jgi:hypothetical protein
MNIKQLEQSILRPRIMLINNVPQIIDNLDILYVGLKLINFGIIICIILHAIFG